MAPIGFVPKVFLVLLLVLTTLYATYKLKHLPSLHTCITLPRAHLVHVILCLLWAWLLTFSARRKRTRYALVRDQHLPMFILEAKVLRNPFLIIFIFMGALYR